MNRTNTLPWWQSEDLAAFDVVDLASILGGLQLLPENAGCSTRLEAAIGIVACKASLAGKARVSRARLQHWLCASEWASGIEATEDPHPNLFTEQITTPEGSFVVLPGHDDGIVFVVRHLLDVTSTNPPEDAVEFCKRANQIAVAILALSDEVARRTRLHRHLEPGVRSSINIPSQAILARPKAAVVFLAADLARLLQLYGLEQDILEPLTLELGSQIGETLTNPLLARPLLKCGEVFVVAVPGGLLSALLRAVLNLANEQSLLAQLAIALRTAFYATTEASLKLLGSKPLQPPTFEPDGLPMSEGFFSLDKDKVIHLTVISDDLLGWSPEAGVAWWEVRNLIDHLQQRCVEVAKEVMRLTPWVRKILHLFVVQGLSRGFALATRRQHEDGFLSLFLGTELVEVISLLEHSDPLALWKYAQAKEALGKKTRVLTTGPLSKYELYLSHRKSFYLSDRGLPNLLMPVDDLAAKLRYRVARCHDRHGVYLPKEKRFAEVLRLDPDSDHPFFVERESLLTFPRIVVELDGVAIWLVCGDEYRKSPNRLLYFEFGRAIAYWLWQLGPSLKPILMTLREMLPILELEIEIALADGWFDKTHRAGDGEGIQWMIDQQNRVSVRIEPTACALFSYTDNRGDRALVANLIRLLSTLCERYAGQRIVACDDLTVASMVETHAPPGFKRMITILETTSDSSLSGDGLPPFRAVQEADQQALLDQLGDHLQSRIPWEPGQEIARDKREEVLREVVRFLFEGLTELASSLRQKGLLEELVEYHEALLHVQKQHRLTLPLRLACYAHEADFNKRIRQESNEHVRAAIGLRFLIEFVTSQPPQGTEALSLETYDRLLALAFEIFYWGTTSDFIHYNLIDLPLSMLQSGRLGVVEGDLEEAMQAYATDDWLEETSARRRDFAQYWNKPEAPQGKQPAEVEEVDRCTEIEFGLSLTNLLKFMNALATAGQACSGMVKGRGAEEFFREINRDLNWSQQQLEIAFDLFSLKPRANFLNELPAAYQREDIYPWRFNRRLSYLRKPLLYRREADEAEVIWGAGQLDASGEYLMKLCLTGRLKAQRKEMKQLNTKIQQADAEFFNDAVADAFEAAGALVRNRVKKVGGLKIEKDGRDLGDIDVLVLATASKKILAVEVKDLDLAKTPAELDHEIRDTFTTESRSAAVKHLERVAWVRAHIGEILAWLIPEPERRGKWRVDGCIIVNRALISPYLKRCPLTVVPWIRLQEKLPNLLK